LLLGALFNAHLNRRRDDRLRKEEQRLLAVALRAELAGIDDDLSENSDELRKKDLSKVTNVFVGDVSQSVRILPASISKIGLLDQDTIQHVMKAYFAVEQHVEKLLLGGGGTIREAVEGRRLIVLGKDKAGMILAINDGTSSAIQTALKKLDAYLGMSWWRWLRLTG
jgi:hypothetical protein